MLAAAWLLACALPAQAQTGPDALRRARDTFEYGDFKATVDLLRDVPDAGVLATETERVEAWKLLGLSYFFLDRRLEAANAFFGLLKQNPDYRLDPFYVPPAAVAFFDQVKKENESLLAPIRERRARRIREEQAEEEARRTADVARQRKLAELLEKQAAERRTVLERRVAEHSVLLAWMPFGAGQFQNGHRKTGLALLGAQLVAGLSSVACWAGVELLREPSSSADDPKGGKFVGSAFHTAQSLDLAKWISAGIFYALWLGGAIEANIRFVPERQAGERTIVPAEPPAAPVEPAIAPVAPPAATPLPAKVPAPSPALSPVPDRPAIPKIAPPPVHPVEPPLLPKPTIPIRTDAEPAPTAPAAEPASAGDEPHPGAP